MLRRRRNGGEEMASYYPYCPGTVGVVIVVAPGAVDRFVLASLGTVLAPLSLRLSCESRCVDILV